MALFLLVSLPACAAELRFDSEPLAIVTTGGLRHDFTVELALDAEHRELGLMNREHLAEDRGMLFDFGQARRVTMWMRNTLIPLDMLFIDGQGIVRRVHPMAEPLSEAIIDSREPVLFVLEIAGGLAAKLDLRAGDRVLSRRIGTWN